jgi:hypothetical protein
MASQRIASVMLTLWYRCEGQQSSRASLPICSLGRLLLGLSGRVRQSNVKLLSSSDDSQSLVSRDSLGDLTTVGSVVHEEELEVALVSNEHLLEAVGEEESGLLVLLVTDGRHLLSTLESSTSGAINTADHSMGIRVHSLPLVRLESLGSSSDLLDNSSPVQWLDGHDFLQHPDTA